MKTNDKSKKQRGYNMLVNFSNSIVRRRTIAFTIAALICSAGVAIAVRAYNTKAPLPKKSSLIATTPSATATATTIVPASEPTLNESPAAPVLPQGFVQGRKPTAEAVVELITLTPDGFEPAAITRPQGRFILAYDNISGYSSLQVQLVTESSSPLHQLTMPLLRKMWTGEFDLPPGKYFLKEASHPDWSCEVTIK